MCNSTALTLTYSSAAVSLIGACRDVYICCHHVGNSAGRLGSPPDTDRQSLTSRRRATSSARLSRWASRPPCRPERRLFARSPSSAVITLHDCWGCACGSGRR